MPAPSHASPPQPSPSSQGVPAGAGTSAGQVVDVPSQLSAASHWCAAARQGVPAADGAHEAVVSSQPATQSATGQGGRNEIGMHVPVLSQTSVGPLQKMPSLQGVSVGWGVPAQAPAGPHASPAVQGSPSSQGVSAGCGVPTQAPVDPSQTSPVVQALPSSHESPVVTGVDWQLRPRPPGTQVSVVHASESSHSVSAWQL